MIDTEAVMFVYKYEVAKYLTIFFYFFTYWFHFHEVENIQQYVFTKKYLMIYTTSTKLKFFERENRNCK